MGESPDPETLFTLLGDEYVRIILKAASEEPMSVRELSEVCDSARSTIYRRVDDLVAAGVLVERTRIQSDGSHHHVYETRLDELTLRVTQGDFEMKLEIKRDATERFTRMWEDIREV
mgnify:CR=1 FL=1